MARRKKFLYHYQSKLRLAESEADIMWLFAQAYDELYEEHLLRKRD